MLLRSPFIITPRLLPGLRIGDGFLSLEWQRTDRDGRDAYRWYADLPCGEFSEADLRSGCQGGDMQDMFVTLLDFLCACGESYAYAQRTGHDGENVGLFPEDMRDWCAENVDELSMLACEIEEADDGALIED